MTPRQPDQTKGDLTKPENCAILCKIVQPAGPRAGQRRRVSVRDSNTPSLHYSSAPRPTSGRANASLGNQSRPQSRWKRMPTRNPTLAQPLSQKLLHHACGTAAWILLHPLRIPPVITPRVLGLPYRRVTLQSDGARLAGWHVAPRPEEDLRAGIVLCHGHNDSRMQFLPMLRRLRDAGFHTLLFDFRTMGASKGEVCTYGAYEKGDALAAVQWLRTEAGVERVGLYGISMGGATALLAAAEDPSIEAVVTDCAFARLEEMVERKFLMVPRGLRPQVAESVKHWSEKWAGVSVLGVDPEAALRGWRPRPLLVIHAERDLLVPVAHGRRLAEAGGDEAELWLIPRAGHVASRRWAPRVYPRRVTDFFLRHLTG